jgi:hypothetical protein
MKVKKSTLWKIIGMTALVLLMIFVFAFDGSSEPVNTDIHDPPKPAPKEVKAEQASAEEPNTMSSTEELLGKYATWFIPLMVLMPMMMFFFMRAFRGI